MDISIIIKIALIGGSIVVAVLTSIGILKWKDDSPLEEVIEKMVKEETGVDIDLTPKSPEG